MPQPAPHSFSHCPLCGSPELRYDFVVKGYRLHSCGACRLAFFNPQPDAATLAAIYTKDYFLGEDDEASRASVAEMKAATAQAYAQQLIAYHGSAQGRLLEVGCGRGDFLRVAKARGFEVHGVDVSESSCTEANKHLGAGTVHCGDLGQAGFAPSSFDACAMFDVIEHARDPLALLREARALLKPGGSLFVVTPDLGNWSAKLLKRHWMEFKPEHLFYFDAQTMQHALAKAGFEQLELGPNFKVLTLEYLHRHFERFHVPIFTRLVALLHALFPRTIKTKQVKVPSSGLSVLSRSAPSRQRPLLSVIVPVYNEGATFDVLMAALLKKEVAGLDKEIILVESNSTDGTREKVLAYRAQPGVQVVLEEKARGKGHAVRSGLKVAQGDFVMIQDGDLEYDIDDYDQLLAPLQAYQSAVVLGSRHSGSWKIREFTGQPLLSMLLNGAHTFFAGLLNLACGSKLKDPFTMYKLFRRDCIHGLTFKANRFDFDWELMIKLLRKGYVPLELPVNYRSRSFKEGKKVSLIRDPISWVWALLRFRLSPLYEKKPRA